ncbi:MAG: hypothetical protein HY815_07020 [Candidatus Riflebacteria bacterium]|nr:hypothetical protein [Candidatus Riflebacteria bacterium]
MDRTLIQDFLLGYLEILGHGAVETEPGVYLATPEDGAPVELTFDPEAAAEKPSRELVTFGSPRLEEALIRTLASGRVQHLHAPARSVDPSLVEHRLRECLTFDRLRFAELGPGRLMEGRLLNVQFVISIHGDVVQQVACPVWIDATTGRPADRYRAEVDRLNLQSGRQFVLPLDVEVGPELVVASTLAQLDRVTTERLRTLAAELELQRAEEERRVSAYFRQREEELAAKASRSRSADSVLKTAQMLAAVQAERDMRLKETELRYRPRVEARVAAVEVLHVPRFVTSMLLWKGTETHRVPVRYDVVVGAVDLPDCPSCGEPTQVLVGHRDLEKPGCGRCTRKPEPPPSGTAPGPAAVAPAAEASESAPRSPGRSRRPHVPAAAAPHLLEQFDALRIASDYWLVVARTVSKASTLDVDRCVHLPDRVARGILDVLARGFGERPLEIRPGPRGDGRILGRGLLTFLASPFLTPDQLGAGYEKGLLDTIRDRLVAGTTSGAHQVLGAHEELYRTGYVVRLEGVAYHVRAVLSYRVGTAGSLARTLRPMPELMERVRAVLRRELGLTSGGADLWLLSKTTDRRTCIDGADRVLDILDDLDPQASIAPEKLRGRLLTAAALAPPSKTRL